MHIIYAILLFLASATTALAATSLSELSPAAQEEISKLCLPIQFKEGAAAYRNCVQIEIASRSENPQTALAPLSFDDKYAVQQACAKAGSESATAYNQCVAQQVDELQTLPAPVFLNVSDDELYAAQQACFDAQTNQGAAAYRQCMNSQIEQLSLVARVELSNLSALNKNALQLRCSANATSAANYRQCLGTEYSSIVNQEPRFLPITTTQTAAKEAEPTPVVQESSPATAASDTNASTVNNNSARAQTNSQATQSTENLALATDTDTNTQTNAPTVDIAAETAAETAPDSRVISRPELVAELEKQALQAKQSQPNTNASTSIETANASTAVDAAESRTLNTAIEDAQASGNEGVSVKFQNAWQWLLDQLATLGSKGWLILAAVLALPALLLGSTTLVRSLRVQGSNKRSALAERIEPGLHTRARNLNHSAQLDDLFEDDEIDFGIDTAVENNDSDAATRFALKPQSSTNAATADPNQASTDIGLPQPEAFDHWFASKDSDTQQQLCIEFLLYWMAYSDNRYAPELKKRLFTTNDLNDSDSIKRWVLMQNLTAFAHVVQHMRKNATQIQLNQSIDFLMTMLVTENNITPSQNTLLRFLADAFNLGQENLQKRFVHAYGHELPGVPRVDRMDWWNKQDAQASQLWDAHYVQSLPEKQQLAVRLGLQPGFSDNDVIQAFRRASRRCHPDRFSELGEKELTMAEVQFSKFEESRDVLLGVTA